MLHQNLEETGLKETIFLKENFATIRDAIAETWQGKKIGDIGVANFSIKYNDTKKRIDLDLTFTDNYSLHCYYKEENHSVAETFLQTFLDDLNTDVCIIEIMKKFPEFGIKGCSFCDNQLFLRQSNLALSTIFSPKDGIFHINNFLQEKAKLENQLSPLAHLSMYATRGARSLESTSVQTTPKIYDESYKAQLFVQPTKFNLKK